MNTAIRRVAIVVIVMIVALVGQLTRMQVFRADELRADPRNSRMLMDEYSRQRGQITAGDKVLAMSQPTDGRYNFARSYPTDPYAFGPVVGYYSLQYATSGIEHSQDAFLNGSDDRLLSQRISGLISGRTPQGGNVELTLNPVAQRVAWDALQRGAGQGPFVGSVAAVRPSTGEVLALVSSPSFNPDEISSQDPDVRTAAMAALDGAPGKPLLNHATQQTLPPGSTMKVISTAAALSQGLTAQTPFSGANSITLPGTETRLENYGGQPCGGETTTLQVAFELSCNVPFVELSQKVGPDVFVDMAARFGIGGHAPEKLGIPIEPSVVGEIADGAQLAMSSIGQSSVRVTTLQNAMVAATISNGGVRMQPQLIRALTAADLTTVKGFSPADAGRAIDEPVAAQLTDLMLAAERHAGSGIVAGQPIASKTGTAEHGEDSRTSVPYTWYIAFVPGMDIAVAVCIESGPGITVDTVGSTYAAPIGREILTALTSGPGAP